MIKIIKFFKKCYENIKKLWFNSWICKYLLKNIVEFNYKAPSVVGELYIETFWLQLYFKERLKVDNTLKYYECHCIKIRPATIDEVKMVYNELNKFDLEELQFIQLCLPSFKQGDKEVVVNNKMLSTIKNISVFLMGGLVSKIIQEISIERYIFVSIWIILLLFLFLFLFYSAKYTERKLKNTTLHLIFEKLIEKVIKEKQIVKVEK